MAEGPLHVCRTETRFRRRSAACMQDRDTVMCRAEHIPTSRRGGALLKANSALFISTSLRRLGSDMLTVSRVRETIVQDQFGTWSLARDPILKFMFN